MWKALLKSIVLLTVGVGVVSKCVDIIVLLCIHEFTYTHTHTHTHTHTILHEHTLMLKCTYLL